MLLHVRYVQIFCDFISFSMIQIGDPYVLEPYKSKDDKASLLDAAIRRHDGNAIVAATLFMRDTLKRGSALYIYVTFLVVVVVGQDDGPFQGSTNKNLFLWRWNRSEKLLHFTKSLFLVKRWWENQQDSPSLIC